MAEASGPEKSHDHKTTRLQEIALEYVHRYWRHLHPQDRREFLSEMLTPSERRALAMGYDDEEDSHA